MAKFLREVAKFGGDSLNDFKVIQLFGVLLRSEYCKGVFLFLFTARSDICFKDSCYTFAQGGNTWPENRKTCQDKGGDLVAMEEEEEWQFVNTEIQKRTIPKPMEYHIGLLKEEGVWKWVNGQPLTIDKWQKIEPDYRQPSGDGDVAVMSKDYPEFTQGLFNDLAKHNKRPFICEIPKGKRSESNYE